MRMFISNGPVELAAPDKIALRRPVRSGRDPMGGHERRQRGEGGRGLRASDKASPTLWPVDDIAVDTGRPVNHRQSGHYPAICRRHAARLIDSKAAVSSTVYPVGTGCPRSVSAIAVDRLAPRRPE